jgi:hypothetical protein
MNTGAMLWFIIYAVATLLFFGIAAVVTVRGISELKDLLRR